MAAIQMHKALHTKGEFTIETTTTVRAIAINGDKQSSIATAVYTIATEQNSYIFSKITAQPQDGKNILSSLITMDSKP